jgi:WD40 repeat protein
MAFHAGSGSVLTGRFERQVSRTGGWTRLNIHTCKLVEVTTGEVKSVWPHTSALLAFSPDSVVAAVVQGDRLYVQDPPLDAVLRNLKADEEIPLKGRTYLQRVCFSADGTLLANGCLGGEIDVWNHAKQLHVTRLSGHGFKVEDYGLAGRNLFLGLAFNREGTKLYSATLPRRGQKTEMPQKTELRTWDLNSGEEIPLVKKRSE